ncbi:MAG: hypothetical protein Q8N81_01960 [bacterium]|nr:hypothetical protein [bacterium]
MSLLSVVYAAGDNIPANTFGQWFAWSDPAKLISTVIQLIMVVAFLLAFIFLLVGGVQWIMSGGDKAAMDAAKNRLTAALVGMAIVAGAYVLIRLVETVLGVSVITGGFKIPSPNNVINFAQ